MAKATTHKFLESQFKPWAPIPAIFEIQLKTASKGPFFLVALSMIFLACWVAFSPCHRAERMTKTTAVMALATAIATPDKRNKFFRAHRLDFSS